MLIYFYYFSLRNLRELWKLFQSNTGTIDFVCLFKYDNFARLISVVCFQEKETVVCSASSSQIALLDWEVAFLMLC